MGGGGAAAPPGERAARAADDDRISGHRHRRRGRIRKRPYAGAAICDWLLAVRGAVGDRPLLALSERTRHPARVLPTWRRRRKDRPTPVPPHPPFLDQPTPPPTSP